MKLTSQQQMDIENSIWVVNTALKKQGLQADEDMRQAAILYMCKCMMRFDPSKGVKWTTFAYKNVYLYIQRTHAKDINKQSYIIPDELGELVGIADNTFEKHERKLTIDNIMDLCEPIERRILALKLQGYKGYEISSMTKLSTNKLNERMCDIREKVKEMET